MIKSALAPGGTTIVELYGDFHVGLGPFLKNTPSLPINHTCKSD